jgi:hypothetical protein
MTDEQQRNADIAKSVERVLNQKDIDRRESEARAKQWEATAKAQRAAFFGSGDGRAHDVTALVESLVLAEQALSAERARADELQEELTGYKETHVHIVRDRKRLESTCVYLTSTLARVDTERLAQRAQLDDAHARSQRRACPWNCTSRTRDVKPSSAIGCACWRRGRAGDDKAIILHARRGARRA